MSSETLLTRSRDCLQGGLMCGFAGFVDEKRRLSREERLSLVRSMNNAIRHRGPDDAGEWVDLNTGVTFGHRRLSILDLSPEGHQPKSSNCGRYMTIYNGEIYNFKELRKELQDLGHHFSGHSDTEVMLSAFSQWGVKAALSRLNGMFALALWDKEERRLFLARDRIGEKPLYYGWQGATFLFASELKALRVHPDFKEEISQSAVEQFVRFNYVPTPFSIFEGIYKLPPGTFLTLDLKDAQAVDREFRIESYWTLEETIANAKKHVIKDHVQAIEELDQLLTDSVKLRMASDVPLGAFLSGGVDSSLVVAMMQKVSPSPVSTFSIGFAEKEFDEAQIAKKVAAHLGTRHTELYVTPKDAMDVVPLLPTLYDEPFSDSSQIPTYLVSKLARTQVTVALSGDAGDELFGGYGRYLNGERFWGVAQKLPRLFRASLAGAIRAVPQQIPDTVLGTVGTLLSPRGELRPKLVRLSDQAHKFANFFESRDLTDLHSRIVSNQIVTRLALTSASAANVFSNTPLPSAITHPIEKMMYLDLLHYLPDDILAKVDRASMGVSLETRIPLLDPRIIDFAWRLPIELKFAEGTTKWILKQVLYRYVPRELIDRPKMGFSMPVGLWLKGPMRDWAETLLDEKKMSQDGHFDSKAVRSSWGQYMQGKRARQPALWSVLMFQAWKSQTTL